MTSVIERCLNLLLPPILALGLAGSVNAEEQNIGAPRLIAATANWTEALRSLDDYDALGNPAAMPLRPVRLGEPREAPPALRRLNAAMARWLPGIAQSAVPVLVPFDVGALLRDLHDGKAPGPHLGRERYMSGFHRRVFFEAGPAGYDASFALRAEGIEDLKDIAYSEPFQIVLAGSRLLYDIGNQNVPQGRPVPDLDERFPGIRRAIHEHHLRYTFERFGVPYVASIVCFDGRRSRYRMPTCRDAERVMRRFLGALNLAGGTPRPAMRGEPVPPSRPARQSATFTYEAPGALLPSTGVRKHDGQPDRTAYSQIRFPLREAPAFVNSQLFQKRNKPSEPGEQPNYTYPWRDSFCERRGFPVGQCPAGYGHQGQDLRPALCEDGTATTCRPHDLVAVRDGVVMRWPGQEALYIIVNTGTEHLRFRYLHMDPREMDARGLVSGRMLREGEVIGQMSNFSRRPAGTSYHLHFDIQVLTRHGWVFVNPYMTLVSSYERLIGGRGRQVADPELASESRRAVNQ